MHPECYEAMQAYFRETTEDTFDPFSNDRPKKETTP